jgi:DNA end-binding protein Ku
MAKQRVARRRTVKKPPAPRSGKESPLKTVKARSVVQDQPFGMRPLWSGTISFGLVSVPVQMYPATRKGAVSLRLLDDNGQPISRRYQVNDEDVDDEQLVRGYELEDGDYVIVTSDELESLAPEKSRDIDLRLFVERSEIPNYLLDRMYFLTPAGDSTKAYRLLSAALERTDRCGIATFVMREKEYLVAIVSENHILQAQTMRFIDEVRLPADVGLPEVHRGNQKRVAELKRQIKKLSAPALNKEYLDDEYAQRLMQLVEDKRRRGEIVKVEHAESDADAEEDIAPQADLLETIRLRLHRGLRSPRKTTAKKQRKRA